MRAVFRVSWIELHDVLPELPSDEEAVAFEGLLIDDPSLVISRGGEAPLRAGCYRPRSRTGR